MAMTGEEIERAIEFLLKNQATLEGQLAETNRIIRMHAESQTEFIQIVTKAISDLAESQRRTDTHIAEAEERSARRHEEIDARIDRMVEAGARTDERLAEVATRADARIAEAEARNSRRYDELDARLDRLVGVVERLAEPHDTQ
jgi:predicted metal-dependent hydrolase